MEVASKHRGGTVAEELDIGDVIGRESDNDKYDL